MDMRSAFLSGKKDHGKEYNFKGNLVFDGKYSFGHKKNGKLYINNILEYEGNFIFDRKWDGKGYDKNQNEIYKLKNGNGKVKEFDLYLDELIFEGEYKNGKRNGEGKEYDDGEIIFEGEYKNGKRNGKGKEYDNKGKIIFEGEFKNGKRLNDTI